MLDTMIDKSFGAGSLEKYELLIIEAFFIVCRCYELLNSHDGVVLSKITESLIMTD